MGVSFGLTLWYKYLNASQHFFPMCLKTSTSKILIADELCKSQTCCMECSESRDSECNKQEGVQNCVQRDKDKYLGFTSRAISVKFLDQYDLCTVQTQHSRFERKNKKKKKKEKAQEFLFSLIWYLWACTVLAQILHYLSRAWVIRSWVRSKNVTIYDSKFD